MSGGVDSTAAALLLREQGHDLAACTFRTRYTSTASLEAAVALASRLGIEHYVLDYDLVFEREVIDYFVSEYVAGRTPNPCVVCNRTIKFGRLLGEADRLGCAYIATGHYARIEQGYLCRAADESKDQTYFLWQLTEQQLARVLFPLGDMTKQQVRLYLEQHGYTQLAHQGESQDICFIADDYRTFLSDYLPDKSNQGGNFVDADGHPLGHHVGYTHYTIGQRKGLGIALGYPAFVTSIDAEHNQVTIGRHDDLYTRVVHLSELVFRGDETLPVMAQIRYRSHAQSALLSLSDAILHFDEPVWAVTPGQSAVFYQANRLVGGGIINN